MIVAKRGMGGGLKYIRIKRMYELSGYKLTGVNSNIIRLIRISHYGCYFIRFLAIGIFGRIELYLYIEF